MFLFVFLLIAMYTVPIRSLSLLYALHHLMNSFVTYAKKNCHDTRSRDGMCWPQKSDNPNHNLWLKQKAGTTPIRSDYHNDTFMMHIISRSLHNLGWMELLTRHHHLIITINSNRHDLYSSSSMNSINHVFQINFLSSILYSIISKNHTWSWQIVLFSQPLTYCPNSSSFISAWDKHMMNSNTWWRPLVIIDMNLNWSYFHSLIECIKGNS